MRKKILLIIIILLCPVLVLAKGACNSKDIIIKDIIKSESIGYTEEKQEPSINNNKIDLGLEIFNINDSITYNITIKNDSEEDYYFTKNSFNIDSDYLEYEFLNDSEIIKRNEEKTIQLKITYKNKIPEDSYNENKQMTITLGDEPLTNPDTKVQYILIILIVLITSTMLFISKKKSMKLLGVLLIPLIPIGAKALCSINLEINADITINEKEAIFLPGPEVNTKMKELAGDDTNDKGYLTINNNIVEFKYSEIEPIELNKEDKNVVSIAESEYPIYMWFDNGTIYWWSEDSHPNLNADGSRLFRAFYALRNVVGLERIDTSNTTNMFAILFDNPSLETLNGLQNWNTSNVTNMKAAFGIENATHNAGYKGHLVDISALKNWDVSNVTTLANAFQTQDYITSLSALKNWNTSNVTDMSFMFSNNLSLVELNGLEDWDTSNVINMNGMFDHTSLISVELLKKWDTSKVEIFTIMFSENTSLESLTGLEDWNVLNSRSMYGMFKSCTSLKSIDAIKNWNVSNVQIMYDMFFNDSNLTSITALRDWNVSNVFNFGRMFYNSSLISDSNSINNWNIKNTANFTYMFRNVPTHPEFTKIQGTWNAQGTFIPS